MSRSRIKKQPPPPRTWLGTDAKVVRHVHVCGDGHLATATRTELVRLGIHRDTDYQLPSLYPALVIACGDSETDEAFDSGSQRAWDDGSPLLLACISGSIVRIGPLIPPSLDAMATPPPFQGAPIASTSHPITMASPHLPLRGVADNDADAASPAEPRLSLYARLGALLVSAQALNFLLDARNQCVMNRVIELNPWSMESKVYKVLKVRQ